MTDNLTPQLIILFTPLVIIILFQISSLLNQTVLSTGLASLDIKDFSELSGISEERIRMIPLPEEKLKFKVLDQNLEKSEGEVIFDLETLKIIVIKGIDINNSGLQELRRIKFAKVVKIPQEKIKISEDGNTFSEISVDKDGNEIVKGKVTFDEEDKPSEVIGTFKKYF